MKWKSNIKYHTWYYFYQSAKYIWKKKISNKISAKTLTYTNNSGCPILVDVTHFEFNLNIKANNIFIMFMIYLYLAVANWILSVCAIIVAHGCLIFIALLDTTYNVLAHSCISTKLIHIKHICHVCKHKHYLFNLYGYPQK